MAEAARGFAILVGMRWALLLLLVAIPTLALAEPKVAVAPLDGDGEDGKVADVVAEAARERAKVTKQGRTEGAMRSLGVSVLSPKSVKKLRNKLDVDVVIYGSVEGDDGDKRLSLSLAGSGKSKLEVSFKSTKQLRKLLASKLPKKISAAMEGNAGDVEAEDEERRDREKEEEARRAERARKDEEDRKQREQAEAERRARKKGKDRKRVADRDDEDDRGDDDTRGRKKKRGDRDDDRKNKRRGDRDDEDGDRKRKRVADRDDDGGDEDALDDDRPRKKRRRGDDAPRHVLTQAALWLDAGAAVARRTLTYQATGMMAPPSVGTAAGAGRIEGEVYPAAFSTLQGAAASIGIVGSYSRTFGLGIAVPGTQVVAPITNGHYSIGARYRIAFGEHAVGFGLSYWRSYYMADRTQLMNADQLDMPDVDYQALAPGVAAHIAVSPTIAAFGTLDIPLMLNSGPIQDPATGYGSSKILALDLRAGAQIVLATHVALQLGLDFEQIGLSFTGQPGSKAATRMVSKATDRSIGLAATIGINY